MEVRPRKPNTTCGVCQKALYRRPGMLKKSGNAYCSLLCYRMVTGAQRRLCQNCSRPFKPLKKTARFCSHSCANMARRGIKYVRTGYTNLSQQRLQILWEAAGFKHCMVRGCTYGTTLDIHRLAWGKEGGKYEIGNMFAICPNHHAEVTRGIIQLEQVDDFQLNIMEGSTSGS